MYDLVIIGGGPAGVAAGVYAARKKIKALMITDGFGGQSVVSNGIENWVGDVNITGFDLAKKLEAHVRRYEKEGDLEIWDSDLVVEITGKAGNFSIKTKKGKKAQTKTVLNCAGSHRRRLGVPGEDRLDGKGIAWCATCDAPLFKDKVVAVIGGGNVGLEAALTLDPFAKKLYLLQRGEKLKGDPATQDKVLKLKKMTVIFNALVQEIIGKDLVSGLRYKDAKTGKETSLDLGGIFVQIGSVPNTDFIKGLVETNQWGEIIVDHKTQKTSAEGIWAAGDTTDVLYKQNNISVGDAVEATLNIFDYLHKNF